MRTLVVYYSRTGTNETLAQQVRERVPGDLDQIVDKKNRDSMAGNGFAAFFRLKTQIAFAKDPADYDRVVVVTPFWAGRLPPATRTYLKTHGPRLKAFALLSACGRGEDNDKALPDVEATAGRAPFASLLVKVDELESNATQEQIEGFIEEIQGA
jgi:flavodoxin